ncbi:MAG TPA: HNH endonuclease signature motif containing protein [Actinocrinis sp.]|nr:HNH endonuclease signature motif containing protein [Actinocrinis sp.]
MTVTRDTRRQVFHYKPTASVERLVRLRDRHCTFPGCAMPATRCDLDHITAFNHDRPEAGGATLPENLHTLCRRHHRLKTAGHWSVQRGSEGEVVWSAPTGHRYITHAEGYAT